MLYTFARFISNICLNIFFRFEVTGRENVPVDEPFVLASNHAHWTDPVVVADKVTSRKISYMAKKELFQNPVFSWVLKKIKVFPVRRGEADLAAVKHALRVLKSNGILGIFPEGTRVKDGEEKEPEGGFVIFALKSKCGILPVSIKGEYKFRGTIHVVIGKPIDLSDKYKLKNDREALDELGRSVMKEIKELGENR